jgi:hypothetical protein
VSERESERAIACVSLGKNGTSPVTFGADVYCRSLKLWNKVSSRQESVPVSFRPKTRPTAGQSEGCYPPERTSALEGTSPLCSPTTVWEPKSRKGVTLATTKGRFEWDVMPNYFRERCGQ